MTPRGDYRVSVTKDYLVFSSAHFITFAGHRCEGLHGHNYRVRVTIEGALNEEAWFVFDFVELKGIMKRLCDEIDHLVLLPLESDRIKVEEDGEIVIGAGVTHGEIANDKLISNKLPFFTTAAFLIGDLQVRNYGTIGGSLAHADPAADWPALVLAADAGIEVQSSTGKRRIKATDFFTGLFTTTLQETEIITAIRIPVPVEGTKTNYQKFEQPASGFAIVGCAIMRFPDGNINIAFTGVSEHAFRDSKAENEISGKQLNDDSIASVTKVAAEGRTVLGDNFASEEYRKHLAKMYLKKALFAVM